MPPLSRVHEAGWFELGPAPGEDGPAVITGHVDSESGPGVFYGLGALKPGAEVQIVRKDGTAPVFRVHRVRRVAKEDFPSERVYGEVGWPVLRLVTCGGTFDKDRGHYRDNIIVYAVPDADAWPSSQSRTRAVSTARASA